MSSRRFRRNRAARQDTPPAFSTPELAALARPIGTIQLDGRDVPVVEPHAQLVDQMTIDRRLCEAGLTVFVRPVLPDEWPAAMPPSERPQARWVLVEQAAPGIRRRRFVNLYRTGDLN